MRPFVDSSGKLFEADPKDVYEFDSLVEQGYRPAMQEDIDRHNNEITKAETLANSSFGQAFDVGLQRTMGVLGGALATTGRGDATARFGGGAMPTPGPLPDAVPPEQIFPKGFNEEARKLREARPFATGLGASAPVIPLGMATGGLAGAAAGGLGAGALGTAAASAAGDAVLSGIQQEYDDAWFEKRPMEAKNIAANTLLFATGDLLFRGAFHAAGKGIGLLRKNAVAEAAGKAGRYAPEPQSVGAAASKDFDEQAATAIRTLSDQDAAVINRDADDYLRSAATSGTDNMNRVLQGLGDELSYATKIDDWQRGAGQWTQRNVKAQDTWLKRTVYPAIENAKKSIAEGWRGTEFGPMGNGAQDILEMYRKRIGPEITGAERNEALDGMKRAVDGYIQKVARNRTADEVLKTRLINEHLRPLADTLREGLKDAKKFGNNARLQSEQNQGWEQFLKHWGVVERKLFEATGEQRFGVVGANSRVREAMTRRVYDMMKESPDLNREFLQHLKGSLEGLNAMADARTRWGLSRQPQIESLQASMTDLARDWNLTSVVSAAQKRVKHLQEDPKKWRSIAVKLASQKLPFGVGRVVSLFDDLSPLVTGSELRKGTPLAGLVDEAMGRWAGHPSLQDPSVAAQYAPWFRDALNARARRGGGVPPIPDPPMGTPGAGAAAGATEPVPAPVRPEPPVAPPEVQDDLAAQLQASLDAIAARPKAPEPPATPEPPKGPVKAKPRVPASEGDTLLEQQMALSVAVLEAKKQGLPVEKIKELLKAHGSEIAGAGLLALSSTQDDESQAAAASAGLLAFLSPRLRRSLVSKTFRELAEESAGAATVIGKKLSTAARSELDEAIGAAAPGLRREALEAADPEQVARKVRDGVIDRFSGGVNAQDKQHAAPYVEHHLLAQMADVAAQGEKPGESALERFRASGRKLGSWSGRYGSANLDSAADPIRALEENGASKTTLKNLEKRLATEPLSAPVVDDARHVELAKANEALWSPEEVRALEDYGAEGYREINAALRGKDLSDPDVASRVALIRGALDKAIAAGNTAPGIVHRGIALTYDELEKLSQSATVAAQGFMSTATNVKRAGVFTDEVGRQPVLLKIEQRSGVPVDVAGEEEILLRPGTKFEVVDVTETRRPGDNRRTAEVHLRETGYSPKGAATQAVVAGGLLGVGLASEANAAELDQPDELDVIDQARAGGLFQAAPLSADQSYSGALKTIQRGAAKLMDQRAQQMLTKTPPKSRGPLATFARGNHSLTEALADRRDRIEKLANDPDLLMSELAESFGDLPRTHPSVYARTAARMMQVVQYLKQSLPARTGYSLLDPEGVPPGYDKQLEFALRFAGATDPDGTLRDIARGEAYPQQVEATRTLHPELFDAFRISVLGALSKMADSKKTLPVERQRELDDILDLDGAAQPAFSWAMAERIEQARAAEPQPQGGSGGGGPAHAPALASRLQTRSQAASALRNTPV